MENHVWVTPLNDDGREVRCRRNYPNQSQGGDGPNRVDGAEIAPSKTPTLCLWYTFSHTHIPRPEDYPVMPTAYVGFTLKPSGFFDRNPALDVPPSAKACATGEGGCHG